MKLKRYLAPDMRQALRLVREEQGPDAVILSNQRVDGGIEIIAAVDYDPVLARHMLGNPAPAETATPGAAASLAAAETAPVANAAQTATAAIETPQTATPGTAAPVRAETAPSGAATAAPVATADDQALGGLQREVAELRALLECQVASLAFRDVSERDAQAPSALRGLNGLGLDADLAMSIAIELGPRPDHEQGVRDLIARLEARLPLVNEEIIDEGGVVALVGPTGVGKTTTVAKLAARFALKHGKRRLALVSLDNFRIGAHEQLLTFGRILGVPVHFTGDADGLRRYLEQLSDKALVLVDTAGVGQRDERLYTQLAPLAEIGEDARVLLTLAANLQREALADVVARFAPLAPSAIVLTKLDEAVSLGAALSLLMQGRVPLAYATDGQRVPEDIHFARSRRLALITRALALAQERAGAAAARGPVEEVLRCA
jgi:flagellar biosynthesis protein FlhF